jgi:competence protein ComEC
MRQRLFNLGALGFTLGVLIRSYEHIDLAISCVCLAFIAGIFGVALFRSRATHKMVDPYILAGIIFCLSLSLGVIRYTIFVFDQSEAALKNYRGENIEVQGIIISEPDERDASVRLVIEATTIHGQPEKIIHPTRMIFSDVAYSRIEYGDEVRIEGRLEEPENFTSEQGREFDYRSYLAKDKIFYELKYPKVMLVRHGQGNPVRKALLNIKKKFTDKLDEVLPFPDSRLAAGLIVAGKKSLPKEIQKDFEMSGTLQIVVLSGYNVTIIAETLMALTGQLSFMLRSAFGITGIVLFTILTGGSATIVRGAFMAILVIIAKATHRRYTISRAFIITGIVMLVYNPMYLVFDPSFQLSFLATAGLIYVSPLIAKRLSLVPERFNFRALVSSTLAAQIAVTPYLMYSMGKISLVAIVANLLITPLVPFTMLVCFVAGMSGFIGIFISIPIAYVAFIFLEYILITVHFFAILPFASVGIPFFPWWLVILVYGSFGVAVQLVYHLENKFEPRKRTDEFHKSLIVLKEVESFLEQKSREKVG